MTAPTYTPRAGSLITRSPVRGLASAADLAASIKASGVHQPVLVRRLCRGCGHAANLSLIVCKHTKS
jgi:ParB-like chromosome segregation protein Spo0J